MFALTSAFVKGLGVIILLFETKVLLFWQLSQKGSRRPMVKKGSSKGFASKKTASNKVFNLTAQGSQGGYQDVFVKYVLQMNLLQVIILCFESSQKLYNV